MDWTRHLLIVPILIPLLTRHRILAQVAGHAMPVIKLLPPLVIGEDDRAWIESAFAQVVGDSQSLSPSTRAETSCWAGSSGAWAGWRGAGSRGSRQAAWSTRAPAGQPTEAQQ